MIPTPKLAPAANYQTQCVRFKFRYLRRTGSWSWAKLSDADKIRTLRKLKELSRFKLHQFRSGGCKPRKWSEKLPSKPAELSEDIKDLLADYFNIGPKIRIFGYLIERDFYIIWISAEHKHSK